MPRKTEKTGNEQGSAMRPGNGTEGHAMGGGAMGGGATGGRAMSRGAMGGGSPGEEPGLGMPPGLPMGAGEGAGEAGSPSAGDDDQGPAGPGDPIQPPSRQWCATMAVHRRLLDDDADYAQNRSRIENRTRRRVQEPDASRFAGVASIPVVVHVVWHTPAQNISDAQVASQIEVLNQDFRATNPDVASVPAAFQPLVADARIEFRLATIDPDGNPTNGITRTSTTTTSFTHDDAVKTAAAGHEAWPADHYLNMWVCPLSGGLLGYAQFPGGPADTDGVVCTHTAFGTTGTATAPFHLGRTATHEVGHYLNLFHIWGDDGNGCGGTDEVDDTPNQGGPNVGVPTFPKVSCDNGPNGDLFMDYMDYVDDAAMVMFTHGQAARMEACLDISRPTLVTLTGAAPEPAGPIVAWSSERLDAFAQGTDRAMYHKWWDGHSWGPSTVGWESLGGTCVSAPEVAAWGPNRLDAFVLGTDRAMYHKWWDGSSWGPSTTGYEYLGGICMSPPRLVTWGPDRLDAFVLGTDRAMYHKWWDGSSWGPSTTDFEYLGGICTSPPAPVAWGPNRLDVFVLGTDSAVYHKWFDGSGWGPSVVDYEYLGGTCVSPPTAVAWGENRLDLFVLGTDSAVYHKWWDGSAWGPSTVDYESLGGICASPPTAVAWGENRLDLFVLGTDSALYHKWFDGSSWGPSLTGWEYLGGICVEPPRVASWAPDRLDVFVVGTDGALYHKWFDGSSWGPSITDYEYLGGVVSDIREGAPAGAPMGPIVVPVDAASLHDRAEGAHV